MNQNTTNQSRTSLLHQVIQYGLFQYQEGIDISILEFLIMPYINITTKG